MNYYDFNRKSITNRDVIAAVYGQQVGGYSDKRLAEINVYPVGPEPRPPQGMTATSLQAAEEAANGGPIYELIDGQAIRKMHFVPIDAKADSYRSLWTYLTPSKTLTRVQKLAAAQLEHNTVATLMLAELTVGRQGGVVNEAVIKGYMQHFAPLLEGDEPAELQHILSECGLLHLLDP